MFLGNHDRDDILRCASENGMSICPDDLRTLRVRHSEVPFWLGATDLSIGFRSPTFSSLGASPTKLGEYLALGLPVVCNDRVGDVRAIVESLDAGQVVEEFTPAALEAAAKGIEPYLGRPREALRERSRALHDVNRAIDLYDGIYRRMLAAGTRA
jgi:glycosyltransferase involved in cell wall biosynthesis